MISKVNSKDATIVDVRTVEEFQMGHVEKSLNIPMHEIPGRLDDLKAMSKPLILCCASGNRSGQVTKYLTDLGVSEVYNAGGWAEVIDMLEG